MSCGRHSCPTLEARVSAALAPTSLAPFLAACPHLQADTRFETIFFDTFAQVIRHTMSFLWPNGLPYEVWAHCGESSARRLCSCTCTVSPAGGSQLHAMRLCSCLF